MQVSYNWTLCYPRDSIKFVVIELSDAMPVNGGAIVLHGIDHMYDDWGVALAASTILQDAELV